MRKIIANRGKAFEAQIEFQNNIYRNKGYGVVSKIPTPMKILKNLGFGRYECVFDPSKSTVDYTGFLKGVSVAFDAKETQTKNFPLKNLKDHQVTYLEDSQRGGSVAFILINFTFNESICLIPINAVLSAIKSKMKSLSFSWCQGNGYPVKSPADYLGIVKNLHNEKK